MLGGTINTLLLLLLPPLLALLMFVLVPSLHICVAKCPPPFCAER